MPRTSSTETQPQVLQVVLMTWARASYSKVALPPLLRFLASRHGGQWRPGAPSSLCFQVVPSRPVAAATKMPMPHHRHGHRSGGEPSSQGSSCESCNGVADHAYVSQSRAEPLVHAEGAADGQSDNPMFYMESAGES
ncbi:uncharacterized protein [Lolium perenne]|uniref:uncharacterized protein n=1 Tax=Lolium perenne TaxID=4522 RepID=UPI0021F5A144|nr:uncharacterized protein LOC127307696 [Lolium perenne]